MSLITERIRVDLPATLISTKPIPMIQSGKGLVIMNINPMFYDYFFTVDANKITKIKDRTVVTTPKKGWARLRKDMPPAYIICISKRMFDVDTQINFTYPLNIYGKLCTAQISGSIKANVTVTDTEKLVREYLCKYRCDDSKASVFISNIISSELQRLTEKHLNRMIGDAGADLTFVKEMNVALNSSVIPVNFNAMGCRLAFLSSSLSVANIDELIAAANVPYSDARELRATYLKAAIEHANDPVLTKELVGLIQQQILNSPNMTEERIFALIERTAQFCHSLGTQTVIDRIKALDAVSGTPRIGGKQ